MTHLSWLADRRGDRRRLVFYFRDAPTLAARTRHRRRAGVAYLFLGIFTATTYRARRHRARAGLHLHVPLAAHPGRDARRRTLLVTYAPGAASRAAPHKKGASAGTDAATASTARPASPSARWASTSATARSSNASSARCASMPATTIMDKVGRPRGLIAYDTFAQAARRPAQGDARSRLQARARRARCSTPALIALVGAIMLVALARPHDARHQRAARPQPALRAAVRRRHPQRLHRQDPEQAARAARFRSRSTGLPGAQLAIVGDGAGRADPRRRRRRSARAQACSSPCRARRCQARRQPSPFALVVRDAIAGTNRTVSPLPRPSRGQEPIMRHRSRRVDRPGLQRRHVLAVFIAFFGVIFAVNGTMIYAARRPLPGLVPTSPTARASPTTSASPPTQRQERLGWTETRLQSTARHACVRRSPIATGAPCAA